MRLEGKSILVTGSSQGIGEAVALRLAQEGADVVVNYHSNPEGAKRVTEHIMGMGRRTAAVQADLSNIEQVQQLVRESVRLLGKLDMLVNNAGVEKSADFWKVTEADYDLVLNVNLKGLFFTTQEFVRHLLETKRP